MTDQETKKLFSLDADPTDVVRGQSDAPPHSDAASGTGESSEKEPFDPYKYQRITIPPDLRAEIIQYSRQNKDRPPPEDTLPPNRVMASAPPEVVADDVANTDSADESPEETAIDLVSPATKRSSFKHPSGSLLLAGIALGVAVVFAIFAAAKRDRPYSAESATATTIVTPAQPVGIREKPERASPAPVNDVASPPTAQIAPQPSAPLPAASDRSKLRSPSVAPRLQTSSSPLPADAPSQRAPSTRKTSPFDAPLAEDAK